MKLIEGNKLWSDLGFCDEDGIKTNKNNEQMMKGNFFLKN